MYFKLKTIIMNIPDSPQKRIVIIGCGFGGLMLARKLRNAPFQIVLLDKNNYHQFQPLFYQVATAGLEPASISFPLRKIFQSQKNIHIRITEVYGIHAESKSIDTSLGILSYDYLVIATGLTTNFFGMQNIMQHAIPMKSVTEALQFRNKLLNNFEKALSSSDSKERKSLLNIAIVGGGATGVEVAGAIGEMRKYVLPKDYPTVNFDEMNIYLIEASKHLLSSMSEVSSVKAERFLKKLGVQVMCNTKVQDYDGTTISLGDGNSLEANTLIWASGVTGNLLKGLSPEVIMKGNRIKVDSFNRVEQAEQVYAIGDVACMMETNYPNGHPQVAPVAMQQGKLLAKNIINIEKGKSMIAFSYQNLGSMATVGRNSAVVELPFWKFQGLLAWLVWMFLHLMSIVGVKNRLMIFINWAWNYITYDQSLRLIFKWEKESGSKDSPTA